MIRAKLILDPKKWLGDNKIMKMDWDVRAMHFHLMLVAWQNTPQAHLETDDNVLAKYLNIALNDDWHKRIKPQLLSAWQKKDEYYVQAGLLKEIEKQLAPKKPTKTAKAIKADTINAAESVEESLEDGFSLMDIIAEEKEEPKKDQSTIWGVGVELLTTENFAAASARAFLAKLAKEYSAHALAGAITQMVAQKTNPIEAKSYLVSMLKNGNYYKKPFVHHNQASGRLVL